MAADDVYPDFVAGEDPDQAYIDASMDELESHIMYGAARLAALMVDIYGSNAQMANFLQ